MTTIELAELIDAFINDYEPITYNYSHETVDEQINLAAFRMMRQLAEFLRENDKSD